MAGLLLSQCNVLILDEPGNHLDVDTIEALAEALIAYKGTVIFTSHDRHFMKRVANCIIEVRDGRVTVYGGQYDAYLYSVNKEIEEGEREEAARRATVPPVAGRPATPVAKGPKKNERELRKEMSMVEKTIARLDDEKKKAHAALMQSTDAIEAMRLHDEQEAIAAQLADAEERWCELQAELEE